MAPKNLASVRAGPAASSPGDLLTELHRRADEAAGQFAAIAVARGAAGQICERAYDALTTD